MHNTDIARIFGLLGIVGAMCLIVPGCGGQIVDPGGGGQGLGSNEPSIGPSSLNRGFGLTFGIADDKQIGPDLVHPSCHGLPKPVDQTWRDSCNPYAGDTSCDSARPILCVRMDQSPAPANLTFGFYNGWVPGVFASTSPVVGERLTSLAAADSICEDELGQGFRMAAFHDAEGDGGWTYTGKRGAIDSQSRHWVYIDDQPGNCWNASR